MRLEPSTELPWRNERVELFLLEEADVSPAYVGWLNDPLVNRYLESRFVAHDETSTRAFVAACLSDPAALLLGVRSRALSGRHVGNIKLGPIDLRHGLAEVGILIGAREAWGAGVGTSAIQVVSQIACRMLGVRKLTAGCYSSNIGSQRAFERVGFKVEGTRKAHFLLDGVPQDLVLMSFFPSKAHDF